MARKNLLGDLGTGVPAAKAPAPRRTGGAVGAVSRTIADLKANAVIEIAPDLIDHAGLRDRLTDPGARAAQEALRSSIAEYGQQVPVLVRHSPNDEGRYEVVYGRRRVEALRALGRPVKALVRDLPDRELIVAQGQENAARRDLTFIEKVGFARAMRDMGFERKIVCDALQIDKTVISRMLTVADAIEPETIAAIGPAPGIGRDRWVALAKAIGGAEQGPLREALRPVEEEPSDRRFEALAAMLSPPRTPSPAPDRIAVRRGARATTITLPRSEDAFADWLAARMDSLRDEFASGD